ncbi:MAG: sugar phosphate isomerase/epimerase family protein [Thermomicrobiales bacterium]
MKLAVQTSLLPGDDLHARFAAAAVAGYDGVEIPTNPAFDILAHEAEILAASAASGIPVAAICTAGIHDPVVADREERTRRIQALQELVACADRLGATGVVSVPVRPAEHAKIAPDAVWDLAVETYREASEGLAPGSARIFLEPLNRFEARFLLRVGQGVDLANAVDHPRCVVLADAFHMNIEEASWAEPVVQAGDLLGHVHIADNNRFEPGGGMIDFRPFFGALKQLGYADYISLECFHPSGSGLSGPAAPTLKRSASYLRDVWASV